MEILKIKKQVRETSYQKQGLGRTLNDFTPRKKSPLLSMSFRLKVINLAKMVKTCCCLPIARSVRLLAKLKPQPNDFSNNTLTTFPHQ